MSIRRQVLMQCGMFDQRFGVGGAFLLPRALIREVTWQDSWKCCILSTQIL